MKACMKACLIKMEVYLELEDLFIVILKFMRVNGKMMKFVVLGEPLNELVNK